MLAHPNGSHTSVCLVDNMQQTTGTKTQKLSAIKTNSEPGMAGERRILSEFKLWLSVEQKQ